MLADVLRRVGSDPGVEFRLWGASADNVSGRALGGFVTAVLSVPTGEDCYIALGGRVEGGQSWSTGTEWGHGGGAADVRIGGTALADRQLVAAGAGGPGTNGTTLRTAGGDGGAATGEAGTGGTAAGKGGTQSAGGAGGTDSIADNGLPGTFGEGGDAGAPDGAQGGGGGDGWYGGGGGTIDSSGRGGGGGSNHVATLYLPRAIESLRGANDEMRGSRIEIYKRGVLIYDDEADLSGTFATFTIPA